jgi:hypothetical protein
MLARQPLRFGHDDASCSAANGFRLDRAHAHAVAIGVERCKIRIDCFSYSILSSRQASEVIAAVFVSRLV